jgi:nucleotide-binding universal stress UspA family protein
MISKDDLTALLAYAPRGESRVLSVYLPVDQSNAAYLNNGYETLLKEVLRQGQAHADTPEAQAQFKQDAQKVTDFVKDFKPVDKTLVIFSNASEDFWWAKTVRVSLKQEGAYRGTPILRPLIEARDEYERYVVVLTDRAQTRIFSFYMGELEEHTDLEAQLTVDRRDASGSDHLLSEARFQHRADEHAHLHMKSVAQELDRLADREKFDRLIIGGTSEATADLRGRLSERLNQRLLGEVSLPVLAPAHEVLEATMKVHEELERAHEVETLDRLITASSKDQQAVTGIAETVDAAMTGRIYRLVYAQNYKASGTECSACASLFQDNLSHCPHCGVETRKVDDLLERLVERTANQGGLVQQMRVDAATRLLEEAGGIGALLRY